MFCNKVLQWLPVECDAAESLAIDVAKIVSTESLVTDVSLMCYVPNVQERMSLNCVAT